VSFLSLVDPSETAAMVVEPVIGKGIFLVPPAWLVPLRQTLADKYRFVLAFDEVQSGIGRTGKFLAFEQFDVQLDLICVAKSLGFGLPFSGVVGKAEIMGAPIGSAIGGTYAGNPLACRTAIQAIRTLHEENLLERATSIGNLIRSRFQRIAERFDTVGDVREIGAMVAAKLVLDRVFVLRRTRWFDLGTPHPSAQCSAGTH